MARCGNYAEHFAYLGKAEDWGGCSRPSGHPGECRDVSEPLTDEGTYPGVTMENYA